MHPHGIFYSNEMDGAYKGKWTDPGGFVQTNRTFTYVWEAQEGTEGSWLYHDHGPMDPLPVFRGRVRGEGDDGSVERCRLDVAVHTRGVEAGELRHLNVHEHDVEDLLLHHPQCFFAVGSDGHLMAQFAKGLRGKLLIDEIVLGDQNAKDVSRQRSLCGRTARRAADETEGASEHLDELALEDRPDHAHPVIDHVFECGRDHDRRFDGNGFVGADRAGISADGRLGRRGAFGDDHVPRSQHFGDERSRGRVVLPAVERIRHWGLERLVVGG